MGVCNETRAARAIMALHAHKVALGESGESPEEDLTDLLTDLRHYCRQENVDFIRALDDSEYNFEEEKGD